jgi:peptide/nickel transport system permease protein
VAGIALFIGLFAGSILGSLHALYHGRFLGYVLSVWSIIFLSLPSLFLGLAGLLLAAGTHWFPVGGITSSDLSTAGLFTLLVDRLHHLALPVLCLSLPLTATVQRIQYTAARETVASLQYRAARARGLSRANLFFKHLILPSLNPVISTAGPMLGALLSGSLVLEMIFSWPGLGKVTYDALFNLDIFLLLGCVSCGSLFLVIGNLSADLLLQVIDPRVRS